MKKSTMLTLTLTLTDEQCEECGESEKERIKVEVLRSRGTQKRGYGVRCWKCLREELDLGWDVWDGVRRELGIRR